MISIRARGGEPAPPRRVIRGAETAAHQGSVGWMSMPLTRSERWEKVLCGRRWQKGGVSTGARRGARA